MLFILMLVTSHRQQLNGSESLEHKISEILNSHEFGKEMKFALHDVEGGYIVELSSEAPVPLESPGFVALSKQISDLAGVRRVVFSIPKN
jgi:hypothetical protein